jgi:hypothetical protein
LLNTEVAFYNSIDDSAGIKPNVPNSQVRWLLGYEQELISNLTGSFQWYIEHTKDYQAWFNNEVFNQQVIEQNRHVLTVRLTHFALQQKLTSSLFIFYSPTDKDAYLKPSLNYRHNDQWSFALGANIFTGQDKYTFFAQHQDNSNAWLRAKFHF